jgi:hypothetical protein
MRDEWPGGLTSTFVSSRESLNSQKGFDLSVVFSGDKFPFTALGAGACIPTAASLCIFKLTSFLLLSSSSTMISFKE